MSAPAPAIELSGVRGAAILEPAAAARLRLRVDSARVRISEEGLRKLLPADAPWSLERIGAGRLCFRLRVLGITYAVELRPSVAANGNLALEVVAARAAGLPIPGALVRPLLPYLRGSIEGPGVSVAEGAVIECDVAALLAPKRIDLPPLKGAGAAAGTLDLEF